MLGTVNTPPSKDGGVFTRPRESHCLLTQHGIRCSAVLGVAPIWVSPRQGWRFGLVCYTGILHPAIADKRRMTVLAPAGTYEVPVPRRQQRTPSLDDGQVVALARLGMALESAMGWPVDIECAYRGCALSLRQCRPITTLGVSRSRR